MPKDSPEVFLHELTVAPSQFVEAVDCHSHRTFARRTSLKEPRLSAGSVERRSRTCLLRPKAFRQPASRIS